jgi:hypothetical protein
VCLLLAHRDGVSPAHRRTLDTIPNTVPAGHSNHGWATRSTERNHRNGQAGTGSRPCHAAKRSRRDEATRTAVRVAATCRAAGPSALLPAAAAAAAAAQPAASLRGCGRCVPADACACLSSRLPPCRSSLLSPRPSPHHPRCPWPPPRPPDRQNLPRARVSRQAARVVRLTRTHGAWWHGAGRVRGSPQRQTHSD